MAELTRGDRRQAPELRETMPYVLQFKTHEMVYEYIRLVVRLFEGRKVEEELRYAASEASREGQATK